MNYQNKGGGDECNYQLNHHVHRRLFRRWRGMGFFCKARREEEAMTAAEAFTKRRTALMYLQHISKHAATFDPEEREKRVQQARTSYQRADELYRKLASKGI